ncbi:MAG: hemolysin family protein, partial [Vicinamibacterales bacterium]
SALMRLSLRLTAERTGRPTALADFLDDPARLFVPVRLLLGLVTATAGALLAGAIGTNGPRLTLIIATMSVFVVVFEMLLPLIITSRDPERVLEILLPSFRPVARSMSVVTRWMSRAPRRNGGGDAEQSTPATAQAEEGDDAKQTIDREERQLLRSIVDFSDTLVREVMTPRLDVVAIRDTATITDLRAQFREQEYSRFPVYRDSLDNILGFVFVKDLVTLGPTDDDKPVTTLLRPAAVVPESKRVPELLKQFQRQQTQCAIVVDEYGGTAGLVTIEDLLEEIVGEIRDEYDVETEPVIDEGEGQFVFSGKVDIDEVAQRLNLRIEREGFETVGGYLLTHLGRVPHIGERFEIDGLNVEVLEVERRRINKVRIGREVPDTAGAVGERAV